MTSTSTGGEIDPASEAATTSTGGSEAEAIAWATLDALGTQGRVAPSIEAGGGPLALMDGDPLAVWTIREQSRLRRGRETPLPLDERSARAEVRNRIAVARKKAEQLRPFLDDGGAVLAGQAVGRLARAKNPPLCIFARGNTELLSEIGVGTQTTVSLVGTRTPTSRGEERARKWGNAFASRGVIVVSGGARGIDLAAHTGALADGGDTVAVLGDGIRVSRGTVKDRPGRLDFVFKQAPPSARSLSLTASGPWVGVSRASFVSRNRLVAALSDAVVLIEGAAGSGALYTIKNAREIGVPTFAVPGDPDSLLSVASNEALANGTAAVATAPEQILCSIGRAAPLSPLTAPLASSEAPSDPLLRALWRAGGTLSIDDLASALECPVAAVLRDGLRWELEGELVREGGCYALTRLGQ